MIVLFVDNLFFTWAASQWAVRLLWQPSDCMVIFVILWWCYYRRINMMMMMKWVAKSLMTSLAISTQYRYTNKQTQWEDFLPNSCSALCICVAPYTLEKYFKLLRWRLRLLMCRPTYDTIRHDTMREFNVDWKDECNQLNLAHQNTRYVWPNTKICIKTKIKLKCSVCVYHIVWFSRCYVLDRLHVHRIEAANIDGTGQKILATDNNADFMILHAGYIYFTVWNKPYDH